MKGNVTAILNEKGGVGKTTTVNALGTGIKVIDKKYKSLVIDYDPQGNLTSSYGVNKDDCITMYNVLNNEATIREAIIKTDLGDIIGSNNSLSLINDTYQGMKFLEGIPALREQIDTIKDEYDYILIDNQPLLNSVLTIQSLVACNDIVIPLTCDRFAMEGLVGLLKAYFTIQKNYNNKIKIRGILLTMTNNTILTKSLMEHIKEFAEQNEINVFDAVIRTSVSIREAHYRGESIFQYAPNQNAVQDYLDFVKEYLRGD